MFLSGSLSVKETPTNDLHRIMTQAILPSKWWLFDFTIVIIQVFFKMCLTIPFISIFIFQEIEHSQYSTRDESINIYGFNPNSSDMWLIHKKIWKNTILLVISILFCLF
jgi:hypothetical protein